MAEHIKVRENVDKSNIDEKVSAYVDVHKTALSAYWRDYTHKLHCSVMLAGCTFIVTVGCFVFNCRA